MEPIPEEDQEALMAASPHHSISAAQLSQGKRVTEEKQRVREIYKSEKINTVVSSERLYNLPASCDSNNGIGTSYNYTYECHYDDPISSELESTDFANSPNSDDIERHSRQTQKVTRVTKVTTTRSVRQIDLAQGELNFDSDGNPLSSIPFDSNDYQNKIENLSQDISKSYLSEREEYLRESSLGHLLPKLNNYGSNDEYPNQNHMISKFAPDSPGIPQVTDIDTNEVSLTWMRPPYENSNALIIGYKVEYRRGEDDPWEAAHDDLLVQTECRITNLEPMSQYQFRVLAADSHTFGLPSKETPPILLRPKFDSFNEERHQYMHDAMAHNRMYEEVQQPGQPVPIAIDVGTIQLEWKPSSNNDNPIAPISGYIVEYRAKGLASWMQANDYLVSKPSFTVSNLLNGEYEFRIIARNLNTFSLPSFSSGFIKIKPSVPSRSTSAVFNKNLIPPQQPIIVEVGPDYVMLYFHGLELSSPIPTSLTVEFRELGDPNWYVAKVQDIPPNIKVTHLKPNYSYEFRGFIVSLLDGSRSGPSIKTDSVQLVWLDNIPRNDLKSVPNKPFPPEYLETETSDSLIICWMPAVSVHPVQGYEVEFRDYQQDSQNWYKVTDTLIQGCKTTVGYLIRDHKYQFRIIAKSAMGYSEPSDPSETITIRGNISTLQRAKLVDSVDIPTNHQHSISPKYVEAERYGTVALLQDEIIRESPPLPERDDSPPPMHRQPNLQWRDPTLKEVIDYLSNHDKNIQLDASGFLQHLTYNDNVVKEETRNYGAIPILIKLLNSDVPDIVRNAAGCLRNLSYGKENDINKKIINDCGGIKTLTVVTKEFSSLHIREETTGALWNISSCDDLKVAIYNQSAEVIVAYIIMPGSGYKNSGMKNMITIGDSHHDRGHDKMTNVFKNGTGILRNISAINSSARKQLRSLPFLIESLLHYLESCLGHSMIDNRIVENIVCVLRNLSYRVHDEFEGKLKHNNNNTDYRDSRNNLSKAKRERSKSAPSGSPKEKKKGGLFKNIGNKKKDNQENKENHSSGVELLWAVSTIQLYLRILQETSNSETLEAVAAAIQNLAASDHVLSQQVRTTVRTEKGLPILVELFRVPDQKVVCSVTTALRNLAMDQRNRELIGKYAMKDLLQKLPTDAAIDDLTLGDEIGEGTINAILGILFEIVRNSTEFTRNLHDLGGTEKIMNLAKSYPKVSARICRYATQLLYIMWQHKELHDLFKKSGFRESNFYSGSSTSRQTSRDAHTLARPILTQSGKRHSKDSTGDNYAHYEPVPQAITPTYEFNTFNRNNDGTERVSYDSILKSSKKNQKGREALYTSVTKKETFVSPSPAGDSWV
uniref:Fibronectin type-III domain-containing protein n=1 Tax=Rhabditophanes sp. KR3021 TaxID=114890 RepID=A0AC35U4F1_9BILA